MRITGWTLSIAALLVALAALGAGLLVVDASVEGAITRQQTAIARAARDYFVDFARDEGPAAMAAAINRRERTGSPDGFRYALIDEMGRTVAGADVLSSLATSDSGWTVTSQPDSPRRDWRVLTQPIGPRLTLVVAEDLRERDALRSSILRGAMVAVLLAAAAVSAVGVAFNLIMFRRAQIIAVTADRIAGGDFGARAPARAEGDVFDHIGLALNAMLTRIEELMTSLRTVTDSLAHDVRMPLMRLKASLAEAEASGADEAARAAALEQAQGAADQALGTFSALLDIARAETGLSRELMQQTDVGALVEEMGELFAPMLEDTGQTLVVEPPPYPLVARVHRLLLRQAIGNLLHNAATHAGPGARVRLTVEVEDDGWAAIRVADDGPGVPADQLGRVQERFVRLEAERATPGSGLGLAIVAACAKLHAGTLVLADNGPGLSATLRVAAARGG